MLSALLFARESVCAVGLIEFRRAAAAGAALSIRGENCVALARSRGPLLSQSRSGRCYEADRRHKRDSELGTKFLKGQNVVRAK